MSDHWIDQAIIYHLYVRSFMDSNGDGVGDLPGLISKIDYLVELGVNTIWLSPIYPSPMKDFGYDVTDYENIDPLFGTLADFDELLHQAHQRHIKVLMDYIPNHTSSLHPWFIESRTDMSNAKRSWYIWRDPKPDGSPPNNWLSVFGGSAWEFDPTSGQYYLHSFDKDQPDLNWRNSEVVTTMKKSLRFWLDRGVDGFRVDAYDFLFKHTDFLDEPLNIAYNPDKQGPHDSLVHIYSFSQPETLDMLRELATVLEEYSNKFMVTEVYAPQEKLIEMYEQVGKSWFAPFNFGLIRMSWSAEVHQAYINAFDNRVGQLYWPTYVLGNHDQSRVATRIGLAQARNAALLLLTLRGIPFIYYGEELGMVDGLIPSHKIQDPFELKSPGLGLGRDPERTPMQWSSEPYAGFSTQEPWLPVHPAYTTENVATELEQKDSFLHLYKKLIRLRRQHKALTRGEYHSVTQPNAQLFAFTRTWETEQWLTILNYSSQSQSTDIDFHSGIVVVDTLAQLEGQSLPRTGSLTLLANQGLLVRVA